MQNPTPTPRTIEWIGGTDGFVRLLDQTLLPGKLEYRDCRNVEEIWEAIKVLRVRGAPAIGIAAAMGVVLGMQSFKERERSSYRDRLRAVGEYLRSSRPTAVNLAWAVDRLQRLLEPFLEKESPARLTQRLLDEARAIEEEDRQMCRAIGRFGAPLVQEGQGVLTHCNAGGL